jgi:hypothetical protein
MVNPDESIDTADETAQAKESDEFEVLRGQVEAVLEAMTQTKAEAKAAFEAKTREAAGKLEEAQREADEVRADARRRLEDVERRETALSEKFESVHSRLLELADGFRDVATMVDAFRGVSTEEVSPSAATESEEQPELDESLREAAHSTFNVEHHGSD